MVRRIALGAAVLVVLVVLGLMFVGHATGTVELRKYQPARDRFEVKRAQGEAGLRQAIIATAPWDELGEPVPATVGCQLHWEPENDPAVIAHVSRCGGGPGLSAALRKALKDAGDQLLVHPPDVSGAPSMAWMKELRGRADWLELQGTPYDFVTANPSQRTIAEMPSMDCGSAVALSSLALLDASRANTLEEGVADVMALSKALLGTPTVFGSTCGIAVLKRTRAVLLAAGQPGAPDADRIERLRIARLTVGTLWHPWVTPKNRAAITPALTPHGACLAAMEGLGFADFAPVIERRYPGWNSDFAAASASCRSKRFAELRDAHLPGTEWSRALRQRTDETPVSAVLLQLSGRQCEGRLEGVLDQFAVPTSADLPDAGP